MELVVTTIINVFIMSSIYILVALGLAFILNMLGILNLAHGAIYMIGGYITYQFIVGFGINSWAALLMSTTLLALFGVFLEKYCLRPVVGDFNAAVVMTIAICTILQTGVNIMVGTRIQAIPSFVGGVLKVGLISVTYERLLTFAIGVILVGIIIWFVNGTKWGQQMLAIAQNRRAAYLQGINVPRVSALACAMGCGLAAVAGSLMGAFVNLQPFMGDYMMVKVLILVILAGIGSIGGIVIAGLAVGAVFAVLPVVLQPEPAEAIGLGAVIVLLLFRPRGFFGHEIEM